MDDLENRWLELIDNYSAETNNDDCVVDTSTETTTDSSGVQDKEVTLAPDDEEEELPIYTATPAQINYWHAFGCNVFLQTLLREYDLDNSSPNVHAYNRFKIGMDETRHVATFAIDETHYYSIQFDEWNASPVNRADAKKVLEKMAQLRDA